MILLMMPPLLAVLEVALLIHSLHMDPHLHPHHARTDATLICTRSVPVRILPCIPMMDAVTAMSALQSWILEYGATLTTLRLSHAGCFLMPSPANPSLDTSGPELPASLVNNKPVSRSLFP